MKLLAFDTSSKALSVAILEDETLLAETTLTIKKNHSITLMPVIDFLMQQIDLTPKDLDRIVVAEGPGSYTGLRIAVATAKTLAHTLGIELVGVSSLLALVPDDLEGLVVPVMDARRNNVYAGFYQEDQLVAPEGHFPFEEVLDRAATSEQVTLSEKSLPLRSRLPLACQGLLTMKPCQMQSKSDVSASNKRLQASMILSLIISNGSKQRKIGSKTTRKQRPLTSSAYDGRNNQERE